MDITREPLEEQLMEERVVRVGAGRVTQEMLHPPQELNGFASLALWQQIRNSNILELLMQDCTFSIILGTTTALAILPCG